jgi:hypothetical protein
MDLSCEQVKQGRFQIKLFKPYQKNTLQGFIDVETPSGMVIHRLSLHQKNGSHWVGLPSKQYSKEDGGTSWVPVIEFATREAADRFRDQVLAAFDLYQASKAGAA